MDIVTGGVRPIELHRADVVAILDVLKSGSPPPKSLIPFLELQLTLHTVRELEDHARDVEASTR